MGRCGGGELAGVPIIGSVIGIDDKLFANTPSQMSQSNYRKRRMHKNCDRLRSEGDEMRGRNEECSGVPIPRGIISTNETGLRKCKQLDIC